MNSLTEQLLQDLWASVMPSVVPPLDEYTAFLWLSSHEDDVRMAITRTAEKMNRNVRLVISIGATDAERYATAIIAHRAAWRKEKARRAENTAKDRRLNGGTNV